MLKWGGFRLRSWAHAYLSVGPNPGATIPLIPLRVNCAVSPLVTPPFREATATKAHPHGCLIPASPEARQSRVGGEANLVEASEPSTIDPGVEAILLTLFQRQPRRWPALAAGHLDPTFSFDKCPGCSSTFLMACVAGEHPGPSPPSLRPLNTAQTFANDARD